MIVEGVGEHSNQRDRPQTMHIQASRVILSNVRPADPTLPGSLASLATSLEAAQQGELFFASSFPASPSDFQPICHKFVRHATGKYSLVHLFDISDYIFYNFITFNVLIICFISL